MADDEKELASILLRERRDDEALVAAAARRRDEPFLMKPVERASHWRPARSDAGNDGALRNPRARRQLARNDQRPQLLVHASDVVHSAVIARDLSRHGS